MLLRAKMSSVILLKWHFTPSICYVADLGIVAITKSWLWKWNLDYNRIYLGLDCL